MEKLHVYYVPEMDTLTFRDKNYGAVCFFAASAFCIKIEKSGSKRKVEMHYIGEF